MAKTDVAVKEESQLPAHLAGMDKEVAGLGNSTSAQDNTLPFLAILQKGSPQVDRQEPEYIKGAEVGMLLNTATTQIWPADASTDAEGLLVVPYGFQKQYVEWIPRTAGGGYVDTHPFDLEVARRLGASKSENGGLVLKNGNQLVETLYTFLFVPEIMSTMVIGASSTALKPMRDWMSVRNSVRMNGHAAPAFSRVYRARTVYQKNDKGTWYNWKITDVDWQADPEVHEICLAGAKAAARGDLVVGRPPESFGEASGSSEDVDDSIPV